MQDAVIADLWHLAFGPDWAIDLHTLRHHLRFSNIHQVPGGFIACQIIDRRGSVQAIAVDPAYQRQGIGRALMSRAFPSGSVDRVTLGSGGQGYLWPGVPADLVPAAAFFDALGFGAGATAYDLVNGPQLCAVDPPIGIGIGPAQMHEADAILEFQAANFAGWRPYFADELAKGGCDNILLARQGTRIIGAVLISHPDPAFKWAKAIGGATAELGCLGVDPSAREQGIGLALASAATTEMQKRGAAHIFVGWTWLDQWYGRLGYHVWRRYQVRRLDLPQT